MKILIICHFFPPTHNAGAEKRSLAYALGLKRLGYEVQVVCAGSWDKGPKYWNGYTDDVYLDIPVRRVHLHWTKAADINRSLYDNSLLEGFLDEWIADWQPDLVHIISMVTLSISVVRSAKKHALPVVFTLTDFWMICPKISLVRGDGTLCNGQTTAWECLRCMLWHTKAYRGLHNVLPEPAAAALLTWASRKPKLNRIHGLRGMALDMDDRKRRMQETMDQIDRVTAPSRALAKVMEESGLLKEPVRVIKSGHDLSWAENLPPKTPSDVLRFGYIGQVIPVKGLHVLIPAFQKAAAYAHSLGRTIELQIYGNAGHEPDYTARIKSMIRPEDNIKFMGAFAHNQLGGVFAQMDALVVPSQWHENNPRVIQEAFAAQTPVIASNVGGITEFTRHGVDGLLFQYNEVDDLQEQLCSMISDPTLIARLREGILPVKTIQEEIEEVVAVYHELTTPENVPV